MADEKPFKHGVDDVQKYEEKRRDTYGPHHGSGNPHLQPGELQKAWHGTSKRSGDSSKK
jgi:hypothetical protein